MVFAIFKKKIKFVAVLSSQAKTQSGQLYIYLFLKINLNHETQD